MGRWRWLCPAAAKPGGGIQQVELEFRRAYQILEEKNVGQGLFGKLLQLPKGACQEGVQEVGGRAILLVQLLHGLQFLEDSIDGRLGVAVRSPPEKVIHLGERLAEVLAS